MPHKLQASDDMVVMLNAEYTVAHERSNIKLDALNPLRSSNRKSLKTISLDYHDELRSC